MKTYQLLTDLEVLHRGEKAHAQALYADHNGRALRWTLLPGQSVQPSTSPHSPVYLVVLQGTGYFAGEDGVEQKVGPNDMAVFAPNETHTARAEEEQIVLSPFCMKRPTPSMTTKGKKAFPMRQTPRGFKRT
jgi:quercetin dioxygenase-like cupin family protein